MAVPTPTFTGSIDQSFLLEPLNGSAHPRTYLYRFPPEIYNTSTDSVLVKFIYTLIGPAGVGWFKKQLLESRIALEAQGLQTFDMESFYGNPFQFGRIIEEMYDTDPTGLLTKDQWDLIKARDESYRSRAITFFNAVRLGTSPQGMKLAAKSGLDHNVDIIENYKYLFDSNSDDPLGLPRFGQTLSTNEFVILPRPDVSQTEVQKLSFDLPVTSGSFRLSYKGIQTSALSQSTTAANVQSALEGLPGIGLGNVHVTGDFSIGFDIQFTKNLSNQNVDTIGITSTFVDSSGPNPVTRAAAISVTQGGVEPSIDKVVIAPANLHNMQTAIDYIRPVNSFPSMSSANVKSTPQKWNDVIATSESNQVLRYVVGQEGINWPINDDSYWIRKGLELEAPRVQNDLQQHYTGFHNISSIKAYSDLALADTEYNTNSGILYKYNSQKSGRFSPVQSAVIPYLATFTDPTTVYESDRAIADYPEPITVSTQDSSGRGMVNGIYPVDYSNLPGVPVLKYKFDHFWASTERTEGSEYLEIDLGSSQPVNLVGFECIQVPLNLEISIDILDQSPRRKFIPVTPLELLGFPRSVTFSRDNQNPWTALSFLFSDSLGRIPITRFIRIKFERFLNDDLSQRFLYDQNTGVQYPFSVEVRNIRIGRSVIV